MARAASTKECWATAMVVPRITRELVAVMISESERTTLSRPGPRTAMTDRTMIK